MTDGTTPGGWLIPPPSRPGLFFGVTTRLLGDMKDPAAFRRALRGAALPEDRWCGGVQVHRRRVRWTGAPTAPREYAATDGLATDRPALALRVFTADCVPVLLADRRGAAFALLHAGWRGVRAGILGRAIQLMARRGVGVERLTLRLGPHIGPCCYKVGEDLARDFARVPGALRGPKEKWRLSLAAALRWEALRAGLSARALRTRAPCTACDPRFHSHRRDRTPARQAAVAVIL